MIIEAPLILPVDGPPIPDGAVLIRGDTIGAVGPAQSLRRKYPEERNSRLELNDCVLLPGLVNAHCHLELTALEGLENPGGFTPWIRKIVAAKPSISPAAAEKGIEEGIRWMLRTGTTTVGDHVSVGTDISPILKSALRGRLFIEVLGVNREMAESLYSLATQMEKTWENDSGRFRINASPHSAHTVHPEQLPLIFQSHRELFSIHLAESEDEQTLFEKKEGPLFDLIRERGEALHFLNPSSLSYLEGLDMLSDKVLAIHVNYLSESDLNLLQKHRMSVVHCPTSHAYFYHKKFPLEALRRKGVNVALGTDSLASGASLSMLDQLRTAAKNYPEIQPEEWIRMATMNGALALKMESEVGSLIPGKKADLIGIKTSPSELKSPARAFDAVVQAPQVRFSMINGKTVIS